MRDGMIVGRITSRNRSAGAHGSSDQTPLLPCRNLVAARAGYTADGIDTEFNA